MKIYGENIPINFAHPMCRCQFAPGFPSSYSFPCKIGNITITSTKKAVNVVRRLAARAIIYASIHQ